MGSCFNSPPLLKTWLSWFGLPIGLLGLCLEVGCISPATSSLIRLLSRRLRRSFFCTLTKNDATMSSLASAGRAPPAAIAKSTDRAQARSNPNGLVRKRSTSPDGIPGAAPAKPGVGQPSNLSSHRQPRPVTPSSSASTTISTNTTTTLPSPLESPSAMPLHSRSKTMSHVDVVGQGKRLSLQFPIQPTAGGNTPTHSPRSRPQSWAMAPSPLSPDPASSSPAEPNILAVLAAQERYVLELKEELTKAEADLKALKRQWALHEANKRRSDVRKVAQMQPVNTMLIDIQPEQDDEDGSNLSMQREMERRKAMLNHTKSSQRKVFSGSRHLRTLSLLSPDKSFTPSFPQPPDVQHEEPMERQPIAPSRASTSSDLMSHITDDDRSMDRSEAGSISNAQRDNIIRAGTQMAADFKNGLFTFIEDIRQATVGDEAVTGNGDSLAPANGRGPKQSLRKPSGGRPPLSRSASSKKATPKSGSIGDDFWKEHGLSEPTNTTMNKKTHTIKSAQTPQKQTQRAADEFEDWDNWDTPSDARAVNAHDSSDESDEPSSETSRSGSARASAAYHSKRHDSKASSQTTISSVGHPDDTAPRDPKRNSIPWPDLVKLSPTHLKRTASHLMKEWEKQLTPPPESRDPTHSHGDYLGRCGSPTGLP